MWSDLEAELGRWQEAGLTARFWWRDDDAVAATPALDRMIAMSAASGAPLGLAVIPARLEPSLKRPLAGQKTIRVLQHGYAHRNHAPAGERACELGLHRPRERVLGELADGRARLAEAFEAAFLPVMVAPWNRLDRALLPDFPGIGLAGVSTARSRAAREAAPGLVEVNAHFDLIDWKNGRVFRGEASAGRSIVGHLERRRQGAADRDEPVGILSHHLDLDEPAWRFLGDILRVVGEHPAALWDDPARIFR